MYCPQCGQQQPSGEMRFCSRCGFPLSTVAELIAGGGFLVTRPTETGRRALSPRNMGVRQGAKMMLSGVFLVPFLALIVSLLGLPRPLIGLTAIICFVGGLIRLLYALMFEEDHALSSQQMPNYVEPTTPAPAQFGPTARASALPPPRSMPATDYRPRRVNTAEIVTPPSITENTTRLLDDEAARRRE